jgi:hypothetical protein
MAIGNTINVLQRRIAAVYILKSIEFGERQPAGQSKC